MTKTKELNAKVVWGKVITRLREQHLSALHVSCGEIKDVEIKDAKLLILTDQQYLHSIITKQENIEQIENAIKFLGLNLQPEVVLLEKPSIATEADLLTLKEYFGEYLKIK